MTDAIICTSLDGRIGNPMSREHGGWTSEADKHKFWAAIGRYTIAVFGRLTYQNLPPLVRENLERLCEPWILSNASKSIVGHKPWSSLVRSEAETWKLISDKGSGAKRVLVCGGAQTYAWALPCIDRWFVTIEPIILGAGPMFIGVHQKFLYRFSHVESDRSPEGSIFAIYSRVERGEPHGL